MIDRGIGSGDTGKHENHLVLKDSSAADGHSLKVFLAVFEHHFRHFGWNQCAQLAWFGNNKMNSPCP